LFLDEYVVTAHWSLQIFVLFQIFSPIFSCYPKLFLFCYSLEIEVSISVCILGCLLYRGGRVSILYILTSFKYFKLTNTII